MTDYSLQAFYFHDFDNAHIYEQLDEIISDHIYDPFTLGKKDMTILELGADIGIHTYYLSRFAKVIYAVEPSKLHLEALNMMIKQNEIKNVKVIPKAISNENGKTKFYHIDNITAYSLENISGSNNDYEEVETITLESLFEAEHIDKVDLLKMDIEGTESKIFTSEGFLKVKDRIKVIIGGWHPWTSMNKENFRHNIEDLGYEFNWIGKEDKCNFSAVRL